jgi:hypothetical protein
MTTLDAEASNAVKQWSFGFGCSYDKNFAARR